MLLLRFDASTAFHHLGILLLFDPVAHHRDGEAIPPIADRIERDRDRDLPHVVDGALLGVREVRRCVDAELVCDGAEDVALGDHLRVALDRTLLLGAVRDGVLVRVAVPPLPEPLDHQESELAAVQRGAGGWAGNDGRAGCPAWATARAQAATYGAAQGEVWPELSLDLGVTTLKTAATQGRRAVKQTVYGPTASLTWLLLDLGGRSGRVGAARNALLAADWTHNAAIADVVRNTSLAFYDYVALRALVVARRQSLRETEVNLAASEDRLCSRRVRCSLTVRRADPVGPPATFVVARSQRSGAHQLACGTRDTTVSLASFMASARWMETRNTEIR